MKDARCRRKSWLVGKAGMQVGWQVGSLVGRWQVVGRKGVMRKVTEKREEVKEIDGMLMKTLKIDMN